MHLRVSKYPPACRDEQGHYLRDDWTSISDIGKVFDDGILTPEEYLAAEQAYVDVIKAIMECLNVAELEIKELEAYGEPASPLLEHRISTSVGALHDGMRVSGQALEDVMRLCLREVMWCKLQGDRGVYVHFGYDYHMYVGYSGDMSLDAGSTPGVYIEEHESPYLKRDR